MHITRLRLVGFKSFVEPTELVIERGLTGVVGPNGCGKSNLLEALRWVMGETSHKSMRAAAMDDVIFSGTATRPARATAEVTIFLDNARRQAPSEFNDHETIEITRRIEREAGSAYRINGREARARDVKILFEDAATGARSPALVRQGQIAEIVNARPDQRRRVLEDAAGIAGLHSRRHEAELRLKAAETNLARLGDVVGQLRGQMESLKRQARQARRFKEISADVRKLEAVELHYLWTHAQADVVRDEAALTDALQQLATATQAEARAVTAEAELAEALPALREAEAARAAAAARLKHAEGDLEREASALAERRRDLGARLLQLDADLARERSAKGDATEAASRLAAEAAALAAADTEAAERESGLGTALAQAETRLAASEAALREVTEAAADVRARRQALDARLTAIRDEAARLERQATQLAAQVHDIMLAAPDAERLKAVTAAGQRLRTEVAEIETEAVAAEERTQARAADAKAGRSSAAQAMLRVGQLRAEVSTLVKLFVPLREGDPAPAVDAIRVSPGYETALGAALGDDLDAPLAETAPVHWRAVGDHVKDAPLPDGIESLLAVVDGPLELVRRLAQVGLVAREDGRRLQPMLRPGQRLVSIEGDLWRWDGFTAAAHAQTAAAQRLAARNRLEQAERQEAEARRQAEEAQAQERETAEALRTAETAERNLRQLWRLKQTELSRSREALTEIERAARETEARLAAAATAKAGIDERLAEALTQRAEVEAAHAAAARPDPAEARLDEVQAEAVCARQVVADARSEIAALKRDLAARAGRRAAVAADQKRCAERLESCAEQIARLDARHTELAAEQVKLADRPAELEARRQLLLTELTTALGHRQAAADALAAGEARHRSAQGEMREAQAAVTTAREAKARTEARLEAARERRSAEARKIREALGVAPDACLEVAAMEPGAALPSPDEVGRQLQRLKGDRERLGGVNLQAEAELSALESQFQGLDRERGDVEAAVAKLRAGIAQLNREAKKRLTEAFTLVDGHFQRLFTTLFGGGEARLELIEGDDVLEGGGLEIIAKPPGKKPATLSLLSGGEQTLTALSLIFAVFLTNPSPICVLDEVDAPLDDANVDRFCTLMERMAEETETRFLVITHHPMTMARTNRLFGVTMAERGISQLVSVDLDAAARMGDQHGEAAVA